MRYTSRKQLKKKIFILGTIVSVLLLLSVFFILKFAAITEFSNSFFNNKTNQNQEVLSYKNKLISDLNSNVDIYDDLINENNELKQQLEIERDSVKALILIVQNLNQQVAELSDLKSEFLKIKDQVQKINVKQSGLIKESFQARPKTKGQFSDTKLISSTGNKAVQKDVVKEVEVKSKSITDSKSSVVETKLSRSDKEPIISANTDASKVYVSNVAVKMHRHTRSGKLIETTVASKISTLQLTFDLSETTATNDKQLTYYIQLFDTKNNAVGMSYNVFLCGKKLDYNFKINVTYNAETNKVSEFLGFSTDTEVFESGTYFLNIFDAKGEFVDSKSFTLL